MCIRDSYVGCYLIPVVFGLQNYSDHIFLAKSVSLHFPKFASPLSQVKNMCLASSNSCLQKTQSDLSISPSYISKPRTGHGQLETALWNNLSRHVSGQSTQLTILWAYRSIFPSCSIPWSTFHHINLLWYHINVFLYDINLH